jgi:hypothetical protein
MGWGGGKKPPQSMRERAAEAVYRKLYAAGGCAVPFHEQGRLVKEQCYDAVDATLDELLEPTAVMLAAALDAMPLDPSGGAITVFTAAIRAAKDGK